jgi:hypothetical protein
MYNILYVVVWTKTHGGSGSDYAESLVEHSINQGLLIAACEAGATVGSSILEQQQYQRPHRRYTYRAALFCVDQANRNSSKRG